MIQVKKEKDGTLTLKIDGINADVKSAALSKSGKSFNLFSTGGNIAVALPDGTQAKFGANLFTSNPDYKAPKS